MDENYTDPTVTTDIQPLANETTEAKGIFQSDILISAAIEAGIRELRVQPWLLDYIFFGLREDPLTAGKYGKKEADRAKAWFLANDVVVTMDYAMQQGPAASMVTIGLVESSESEVTLGDTHYEPEETVMASWPVLAGPFAVAGYDPATGIVELPPAIGDAIFVVPGMFLVDSHGIATAILAVTDRYSVTIAKETVLDLSRAYLKGAQPPLQQGLESLAFKEVYRIGCHAHGEPFRLPWLHSIVLWCLLKGKQIRLEERGFERSVVSSGPFARDERWGTEQMWTRYITVTGFVRQYWPKGLTDRITNTGWDVPKAKVAQINNPSTKFVPESADPVWQIQDVGFLGDE